MASQLGTVIKDDGTCLKIEVLAKNEISEADSVAIGITFLIGLLLGGIITLICAKFKLDEISDSKIFNLQKSWNLNKGKKDPDVEKLIQKETDEEKKEKEPVKSKNVLKGRRGKAKKKKDETLVPVKIITLNQASSAQPDQHLLKSKSLADILMSEKMGVDIATSDLKDIEELDRELNEENINVMIQMLRVLLRQQIMEGRLSDMEYKNILKKMQEGVEDIITTCQNEKEKDEKELNEQLKNDPEKLESESDMLHTKYVTKMRNLLTEQKDKLYKDMKKNSQLSEDEVEVIMSQFTNCMLETEKRIENERQRQEKILSSRLDKRKNQSQTYAIGDKLLKNDLQSRTETLASTMDMLIDNGKLLDRQKHDLINEFENSVQKIQDDKSKDSSNQKVQLGEKLKDFRDKKTQELLKIQELDREDFHQQAEQSTSTEKVMDAYHELLHDQRDARDKLTSEMDAKDVREFETLKKEERDMWDDSVAKVEDQLYERLKQQARLTESEAEKMIRLHQLQMKEYEKSRKEERRKMEEKIKAEYEARKANREEAKAMRLAESNSLKSQQEKKIKIVLNSQIDLTEEAKNRIMNEHEQHQLALTNQLEMSRLRQQKRLEQRLEMRKAKVAQLKEKAEEAAQLKTKEREQILEQLQEEIEEEERLLEDEKKNKKIQLKNRLLKETKLQLEEHEKQISMLIARLQVSAARRQVEIQRQQKQIKELENKVADYVEDPKTEISPKASDQVNDLLQRHEERVEYIAQHITEEKERQENIVREKLQRRMIQRERTMVNNLENASQSEWKEIERKNAGMATKLFSRLLINTRHKTMIKELEKEMEIEMQKKKDELDKEMESELEHQLADQKKKFLAAVAAMSNMSKNDIDGIVKNAVTDTGGNDKDVKKMVKEMKTEIERAKSEIYRKNESNDSPDDYRRRRTQYDEDSESEHQQRRSKQKSRPKTSFRDYDDYDS